MDNTMETLKRYLEHAPQDPGQLAADLAGWETPDGLHVCAHCAGRIMARGCQLPRNSEPVWADRYAGQVCALCGKGGPNG